MVLVFENIENTVLGLSENYPCSPNLVFLDPVFFVFKKKKKKLGSKQVIFVFLVF